MSDRVYRVGWDKTTYYNVPWKVLYPLITGGKLVFCDKCQEFHPHSPKNTPEEREAHWQAVKSHLDNWKHKQENAIRGVPDDNTV